MIRALALALVALPVSLAQAAPSDPQVIAPAAAIALADGARPGRGTEGRFAMQVAATGGVGGAVFLNSSPDYRAPDDLSFRLSPNVVHALDQGYGVPAETYLRGKHVVVDGTVRRELIVNTARHFPGQVVSANRWQHVVRVLFAHQIVAVD